MTSVSMVSVFTSSVPTCSPVGWRLSTTTDPFELFEEARSLSGVSDAQARSGRDSDASSERMDRIEGLLEGMAAKFAAQQLQMQTQLQQVTEAQRAQQAPRSSARPEHGNGLAGRVRGSEASINTAAACHTRAGAVPSAEAEPAAARCCSRAAQQQHVQYFLPQNFGLKMPKMKDLDWPGFPKFSGKEIYAGVGADFLAWGKTFVQRLVAAQLMSGGDWPDDFKILALNNKLEGPALAFFDKMLPKWVAGSNTVEHVMDRMLGFYSTMVPVSKAMDLMSEAKPSNKTWTEHFQYLVTGTREKGDADSPGFQPC
ncbi:hypothetical protein PF007_g19126 [Phytophthora fragariae]|uniref:Uncharacterized protein n=1 Tax=Phytophthora fragariae TaxID=53985 RepID=A0A6A3R613_9STRA|nr:hypothetical protein PF007_g19126 [Phytophthora fragariae]